MPEVARRSGIGLATLYRYINPDTPFSGLAPYPAQVVLEQLALARLHDADKFRFRRQSKKSDPLDSVGSGI